MTFNLRKATFDPWIVQVFHKLVAFNILAIVGEEILYERWRIHLGELFPRYYLLKPFLNPYYVYLEWASLIAIAIFIFLGVKRIWAYRVGFLILLLSTLQHASNHKILLLSMLAFLSLEKENPKSNEQGQVYNLPALAAVKIQIILVYFFTIINKLQYSFYNGESLQALFYNISQLNFHPILDFGIINILSNSLQLCSILAMATLLAEVMIPILLNWRPRVGLGLLLVCHISFSLLMPGIWVFTLTMFTIGFLYQKKQKEI